jgi:hypothetical protein
MRLLVDQSIENENYVFVFSIDQNSISSDDAELFVKYGVQPINLGGTFTDNTSATFTLADDFVNLPSDFPVRKVVTIVSPSPFATNTANRLLVYRTTIQTAISTAVTNLRNITDSFTGKFITNI